MVVHFFQFVDREYAIGAIVKRTSRVSCEERFDSRGVALNVVEETPAVCQLDCRADSNLQMTSRSPLTSL